MGTITERLLEEEFKTRMREADQGLSKVSDIKDALERAERDAKWQAIPLARFLKEVGAYHMYGVWWRVEGDAIISHNQGGDVVHEYKLPKGWE